MTANSDPLLTVVIPVYNEKTTIEDILLRVQNVGISKEIVVVDDASTDGTREFLMELARHAEERLGEMWLPKTSAMLPTGNIRVLLQPQNRGKGAALRRGFEEARGQVVVIQDADLEYDPRDYHKLLEPIQGGEADVVYGSRFMGGPHRVLLYWHYVGNKLLTLMSDMVTDLNLSDVWTCYKAFKREVLENITIEEDRFGFEQEITIKIAKNHWRVYEVPISYYGRTYAEGKKITWRDGIRALWCILRYTLKVKPSPPRPAKNVLEAEIKTTAKNN